MKSSVNGGSLASDQTCSVIEEEDGSVDDALNSTLASEGNEGLAEPLRSVAGWGPGVTMSDQTRPKIPHPRRRSHARESVFRHSAAVRRILHRDLIVCTRLGGIHDSLGSDMYSRYRTRRRTAVIDNCSPRWVLSEAGWDTTMLTLRVNVPAARMVSTELL